MSNFVKRFSKDTRGQMVILFALMLPALAGTVGVAVDVGRAVSYRTSLSAAADAAVLAAVRSATSAATSTSASVISAATTTGKAIGQTVWTANTATMSGASLTLNLTYSSGTWTATANYSSNVPSTFTNVLGVESMPVSGTATASAGVDLSTYTNLYFLLDISQSMSLPSTKQGSDFLWGFAGCEFACHVMGQDLTFNLLRSKKYPMRIDTLREAAADIVSAAAATGSSKISMAAYTFNHQLKKIANLTNNLSSVLSVLNTVDTSTVFDGTHFDDAISKLTTEIPAGGDGKSASSPATFLFIITDGVQNGEFTTYRAPSALRLNNLGFDVASINPSVCKFLKAKNVKVGIVYTTYLPSKGLFLYDLKVKPKAGNIPVRLKACASEGLFFEASDHDGIMDAVSQLFTAAMSKSTAPRLTN